MKKSMIGMSMMLCISVAMLCEGATLVASYNFNHNSGSTALWDFSGYGHVGSLTNMNVNTAWQAGRTNAGNALTFDGVDDYVKIADQNVLDMSNAITVSLWIKPVSIPSNHIRFVEKH